jgi:outer membrane protein assembly factor BamB
MKPTTRPHRSRWLLAALPLLLLGVACAGSGDPGRDDPRQAASPEGNDPKGTDAKTVAESTTPWPMYGGTIHRNMVNTVDKNVPASWSIEEGKSRNVKWVATLGQNVAYGGPTIAGGKIFIGTNNQNPRDPKVEGDKGILMCFRESDGKFLWQAVHDKLDNPEENDWPQQGIASTPAVDGDRVYYVSNRCELVCADVEGDQKTGKAKFVWSLDMAKKLNVYPCFLANCSPLIVGDLVFVVTGNGVESKNHTIPHPDAPSFLAVNKKSGEVAWKDSSPGKHIMEGQWGNPVAVEVKGVTQAIFPGGDGWLYAFEATSGKLLWKFDCNPKAAEYKGKGRGDKNYLLATPVIHDNKLYIGVGQNPEDGPGLGHLWCIDIAREPKNKDKDLSPVKDNFDPKAEVNKDSGLVWHYGGPINPKPKKGRDYIFGRTLSTVAVHDGLVYAAELDGFLHCLDAKTGEAYWVHDMKDGTWASPYYVDGKVYIGTEGGDVLIFEHGKVKKAPAKINMEKNLQLPVVVANGVLYVNTGAQLYAIAPDKK